MNISPLFEHRNRNIGRIKAIAEHEVTINVNPGHGGGLMTVPRAACDVGGYKFNPKVNDRIMLCINEDNGEYVLEKLDG